MEVAVAAPFRVPLVELERAPQLEHHERAHPLRVLKAKAHSAKPVLTFVYLGDLVKLDFLSLFVL